MPRAPRRSQFPPQRQLILPLLEVLQESGGAASPKAVADRLAAKVGLDAAVRAETTHAGVAGEINAWDRHTRWVRQLGVFQGHIGTGRRKLWDLTEQGRSALRNCRPGVIVTVYETDLGVALWAEAEAAAGVIEAGSVNLLFTSTPYPLLREKQYGNRDAKAHVEWLAGLAEGWKEKLTDDGSLVLNLADVWEPGQPTLSLWQERLMLALVDEAGLFLAGKHFWENPSKLPSPAEWVTIRRVRVTPSVEQLWWLSKTPHPKANNRNVLRPYSRRMREVLAHGGEARQVRPSGHVLSAGAFAADNGGSIPHNLIVAPNTVSGDAYQRRCREAGLPIHPARFPDALPEYFIRKLTEPGDVVWDCFFGSGKTGEVAERLGRRWIGNDKSLTYLEGSAFRFDGAPGYRDHLAALRAG